MVRRLASLLAGVMLIAMLPLVGGSPASAVQASQPGTVAGLPSNTTPHVLDGEVYAVAVVGDVVVLGGRFTQARNFAEGSPIVPRTNILAFDRRTGLLIPEFKPVLDDVVRALAPAADGTSVYVGGQFGKVDGVSRFKLARLDVRTGLPVKGFNPRLIDAAVMDVDLTGDRLVITGKFTKVGQDARQFVAELDAATGLVRPGINSTFTGAVWAGTPHVYKTDITPDGRRAVLIGNFRTVDGLARVQAAMLDLTVTPAVVTGWATSRFNIKCGSSTSTQFDVRDVDVAPDGSYFVIGATGGHTAAGALCDGVSRFEIGPEAPNQEPTWFDLTGGDSVYSVAATQTAVYAGGHFRWFNNPVYVQSFKGPGAVDREGLVALDPVNGVPLAWNPGRDRGQAVWDLVATDDGLYVASDTDRIARYQYRGRIAFFPLTGGTPVPQPRAADLPVDVHLVSPTTALDRLVRRQGFDGRLVGAASTVEVAGTGWTSARAAFVADDRLWVLRSDGTLVRRVVDGAAYGPAEVVDLNGLSSFATEMRTVTSAFYDEGRMYYTLSGANALYMRYLTVESGIVGATRFQVAAGTAAVNWANVRGAFLAGGSLYWAHSATGVLSRVGWTNRAPVTTSSTPVSGPSTGVDWSAQALFTRPAAAAPTVSAASTCSGTRCQLTAQVTVPPGSRLASVVWDLGDGRTATGDTVRHDYAPGTWTARVAVSTTDSVTATASTTTTVVNAPPVAQASVSCAGLECTFDASTSADPDGTVVSSSWDFKDGTTASGTTVTHAYGTSGTRTVVLTVTDDRGATATRQVSATPAASSVAFVGVSSAPAAATVGTWSVKVPAGVTAGDTLLLFWSGNGAAVPTAPGGWTAAGAASSTASATAVWSTTASAGSAGSTVTVTAPTLLRADLVVAAYRGAQLLPGAATVAAETEIVAAHRSPAVSVGTPGSWLVSYWADKSSTTTVWAPPPGQTQRHQWAGSGSGHVSELLTDSAGPVPTGTQGGLVAVADSAQRNATMASIVLSPVG